MYDPLDHRLDGGGGDDTLRIAGHGVTLDLTAVPSTWVVGSQSYASYAHGGASLLVDLDIPQTVS